MYLLETTKMENLNKIIQEELEELLTEKDPSEYNRTSLIDELSKIATQINQPKPTKELDSGSDALVFETSNKDILIRVEQIDDDEYGDNLPEYQLSDWDIQATGGVSKIYHIDEYNIDDITYLISWKERVNPNFEYVLYQKYGENASEVIYALHLYELAYGFSSSDARDEKLNILKNTRETSKLYLAIMEGLPVGDLSPDSNMGINSEGYIVAFDV